MSDFLSVPAGMVHVLPNRPVTLLVGYLAWGFTKTGAEIPAARRDLPPGRYLLVYRGKSSAVVRDDDGRKWSCPVSFLDLE